MIGIFDYSSLVKNKTIAESMFIDRGSVFCGRLGWPLLKNSDGKEIDSYDDKNAVYIVSFDASGKHRASVRVHEMQKRTMFKDIFSDKFRIGSKDLRKPLEITRLLTSPHLEKNGGEHVNAVIFALCQYSLQVGAETVCGVCNKSMQRIYRRFGWSPDRFVADDSGELFLAVWSVSSNNIGQIYAASHKRRRERLCNIFQDYRKPQVELNRPLFVGDPEVRILGYEKDEEGNTLSGGTARQGGADGWSGGNHAAHQQLS